MKTSHSSCLKKRWVQCLVAVRKRAAPSDEVGASSDGSNGGGGSSTSVSAAANNNNTSPPTLIKETAWSLKEVVFAKEEVMNDIAVVDFVSF